MDKWQEFLLESAGFKKRIRSYVRDRDVMFGKGGQKNTPPFTRSLGTHVTFDKQIEEEVEPESFEKQPELDPKIWQDVKLNKNVSKRLLKIANEFIEGLEIDATAHRATGNEIRSDVAYVRSSRRLAPRCGIQVSDISTKTD